MATDQVSELTIKIIEDNYLRPNENTQNPAILAAIQRYRECKQAYEAARESHTNLILEPQQESGYVSGAMDMFSAVTSFLGGAKPQTQISKADQVKQHQRDRVEPVRAALLAAMNNLEKVVPEELKKEKEEKQTKAAAERVEKRKGKKYDDAEISGIRAAVRYEQERKKEADALKKRFDPTEGGLVQEIQDERVFNATKMPERSRDARANAVGGKQAASADKGTLAAPVAEQQSSPGNRNAWAAGVTRAVPTGTGATPAKPPQKGFVRTGHK